MGGVSWTYWTKWEESPALALEKLRQQVYGDEFAPGAGAEPDESEAAVARRERDWLAQPSSDVDDLSRGVASALSHVLEHVPSMTLPPLEKLTRGEFVALCEDALNAAFTSDHERTLHRVYHGLDASIHVLESKREVTNFEDAAPGVMGLLRESLDLVGPDVFPKRRDWDEVVARIREFDREDFLTLASELADALERRQPKDAKARHLRRLRARLRKAVERLHIERMRAGRRVSPMPPWLNLQALPEPTTEVAAAIEQLLQASGTDGTGSILDIMRLSDDGAFATAMPATDDLLRATFGTVKPAFRRVTDEGCEALAEDCERWHALYFAAFRGRTPVAWVFAGASGD